VEQSFLRRQRFALSVEHLMVSQLVIPDI